MNILSKILFFLAALVILVVGYFIGIFILALIFLIMLLMSVLFPISWLFNNILNITYNKPIRFIIKLGLAILVSAGFLALFSLILKTWVLTKSLSFQIIVVWLYNIIVFTISYTMLKSKSSSEVQIQKNMYVLSQELRSPKIMGILDIIIMIIFPAILTFVYYSHYLI
jgi:hypothetical protein